MVRERSICLHVFRKIHNSDCRHNRIGNLPGFCSDFHCNYFGCRAGHLGRVVPGVSINRQAYESGLTRSVVSTESGGYMRRCFR